MAPKPQSMKGVKQPRKQQIKARWQAHQVRKHLVFSISQSRQANGDQISLTLFSGRKSLTRQISSGVALVLSEALSRSGQSS